MPPPRTPRGIPARTPAQKRADALADICKFFLDHQTSRAGGRHRPHVNTIVDLDKRAASDPGAGCTADGFALSPETIRRLLCDCGVHRVVTKGRATILDYGSRTQTIPAPLFNTLVPSPLLSTAGARPAPQASTGTAAPSGPTGAPWGSSVAQRC